MLEAEASAVNAPSHSRGGEALQPEHNDEESEFPELEILRRAKTHWRETTRIDPRRRARAGPGMHRH